MMKRQTTVSQFYQMDRLVVEAGGISVRSKQPPKAPNCLGTGQDISDAHSRGVKSIQTDRSADTFITGEAVR